MNVDGTPKIKPQFYEITAFRACYWTKIQGKSILENSNGLQVGTPVNSEASTIQSHGIIDQNSQK